MLEAAESRSHGLVGVGVSFVLVFACLLAWSVATPMYGTADEQVHMVTAYAVVHGDDGRTNAEGEREFVVPAVYTGETICYAFNREAPASCLYFDSSAPDHVATSTAWTYPPFYYVLVGWPSLLSSGLAGLYMMRVASAFWAALLLALALHSVARVRDRGPLLLGVTIAITPAVLSFGGTVNPSGLSLAAALAVWTGGITLVRTERLDHLSHSLARVGAPLCLFLLLRRDTVVWASVIGAILLVVTPGTRLRELARSGIAWMWVGAAALCATLQLRLSGASTATSVATGGGGDLARTWGDMQFYLDQIGGGILGWLDTRLPELVYDVFTYGPALLAILALCVAPRRIALAVAGVTMLVLATPLAIGAIRYGYVQGRYVLPLALGIPVLGGLGIAERVQGRRWPRALVVVPLIIIGVAHLLSFAYVMRRFTAGAHGAWWFSSAPPWTPPVLAPVGVMAGYAAALAAFLVWIYGRMELATPARADPGGYGREPGGTDIDDTRASVATG